MRKRLVRGLLAVPLVLLLSGCLFLLQGFVVVDGNIGPGQKTTARFTLRPATDTSERVYQFVVVGVSNGGDLTVGKATWGANGKFGGPKPMPVSPDLPAAMQTADTCSTSGFAFSDVTNTTWKAFMIRVRTKGAVNQTSRVDVVVRAAQDAGTGASYQVLGVTGIWVDDDTNGTIGEVDSEDGFACSGIGTSSVYVS